MFFTTRAMKCRDYREQHHVSWPGAAAGDGEHWRLSPAKIPERGGSMEASAQTAVATLAGRLFLVCGGGF